MGRIILRCIALVALLGILPVVLSIVPVFHWVDPVLLVYLWLLFHPLRPQPWLWRTGWLLVGQSLSPILPIGVYLLAGFALTALMRFLQRSYVEHTHPVAFLALLGLGVLAWEGIVNLGLELLTVIGGTVSILPPAGPLALIVIREIIGVVLIAALLIRIRSFVLHQSVQDTLRHYYEHLQTIEFRSISA